jgi:phosphonate transport system substrate-binding protein
MMKKLVLLAMAAFMLFGLVSCKQEEPLRFVFIPAPGIDLAVLEENYGGTVDKICEELDKECEIIASTSYAAVIEALRNGDADIARLGPFSYTLAEEEIGVVPVVREIVKGGDHYLGLLIAPPGRFEEPFDVSQLRGKAVALTDPGSTSGYLFAVTLMGRGGVSLDDIDYAFLGGHPVVIEAVLNGAVDAGAVADRRLRAAVEAGEAVEGENFVILAESDPIINSPWVVRPDLDEDTVDALYDAFMSVPVELLADGAEGFVKAADGDYDFIREMAEFKAEE